MWPDNPGKQCSATSEVQSCLVSSLMPPVRGFHDATVACPFDFWHSTLSSELTARAGWCLDARMCNTQDRHKDRTWVLDWSVAGREQRPCRAGRRQTWPAAHRRTRPTRGAAAQPCGCCRSNMLMYAMAAHFCCLPRHLAHGACHVSTHGFDCDHVGRHGPSHEPLPVQVQPSHLLTCPHSRGWRSFWRKHFSMTWRFLPMSNPKLPAAGPRLHSLLPREQPARSRCKIGRAHV